MSSPRRLPLLLLVVVLALAACTAGTDLTAGPTGGSVAPSSPDGPIELIRGEGCADAFFWAATASGDHAVTVSVAARERTTTEATTVALVAGGGPGAGDAVIEVLRGHDLPRNFCTDLPVRESEPTSTQSATAGSGQIVIEPDAPRGTRRCGSAGTLRLEGLVAEDGTTFAPIEVRSTDIGCRIG